MKILIDMNLSPESGKRLTEAHCQSLHWAKIGDARAPDSKIKQWAKENDYVVFTHDLDFGALLASTGAAGPSVIQLRCDDTRPDTMGTTVIGAIQSFGEALVGGALVTVDPRKMRATILPLKKSEHDAAGDPPTRQASE